MIGVNFFWNLRPDETIAAALMSLSQSSRDGTEIPAVLRRLATSDLADRLDNRSEIIAPRIRKASQRAGLPSGDIYFWHRTEEIPLLSAHLVQSSQFP